MQVSALYRNAHFAMICFDENGTIIYASIITEYENFFANFLQLKFTFAGFYIQVKCNNVLVHHNQELGTRY